MLAVAITILIVDIFTCTEFLSWASLLLFATWGTWQIGAPWQWSLLIFIAFLALACMFYYTLWNLFVRSVIMGKLLKKAPKEFINTVARKTAYIIGEGDNFCILWEDCVIPIHATCCRGLAIGDKVRIDEIRDAQAYVHKV